MRLLPSIILALTGVLTAIGIALLAVTLAVPLAAEDWGFRGFTALFAITFATVGWVIARRQPGNTLGWLLPPACRMLLSKAAAQTGSFHRRKKECHAT